MDRAAWWIFLSNALALIFFLLTEGVLLMLLWPYWVQSVVIGFFAWKRIRALKRFNADGVRVNDEPLPATAEGARRAAGVFALVYFAFHLLYAIALLMFTLSVDANGHVELAGSRLKAGPLSPLNVAWILLSGALFWASHRASHREHVAADLAGCPHIGTLVFMPMARILPMHLTILLGGLLVGGAWMLFFAAIKTGVDVLMHTIEHRSLQGGFRRRLS